MIIQYGKLCASNPFCDSPLLHENHSEYPHRYNLDSPLESSPLTNDSFVFLHAIIFILMSIVFILLMMLVRLQYKRNDVQTSNSTISQNKTAAILKQNTDEYKKRIEKKILFLKHNKNDYGYPDSPRGFIDSWRANEFPNLIPPISAQSSNPFLSPSIIAKNRPTNLTNNNGKEYEVYLDYAGAALASRSQLDLILSLCQSFTFANPHSSGIAAHRTHSMIQKVKQQLLHHFDADSSDIHSGYDILFTSGTTHAMEIVSSCFPWNTHSLNRTKETSKSMLVYSHNVHTSVLGMRGPALSKGAGFLCENLERICDATVETFQQWQENDSNNLHFSSTDHVTQNFNHNHDRKEHGGGNASINHLLVLPAECNFGGSRPDLSSILSTLRSVNQLSLQNNSNNANHKWYSMLDIAKASCTQEIHINSLQPHFASLSFYKLFGYPTGLGVLFVKKSCISLLTQTAYHQKRYFGGGSVNVVLPNQDFMVPKEAHHRLDSLSHGTSHFQGIISLQFGFQELNHLGGMNKVCSN